MTATDNPLISTAYNLRPSHTAVVDAWRTTGGHASASAALRDMLERVGEKLTKPSTTTNQTRNET